MFYDTDSLDSPLFIDEGPSDPTLGPPSPAAQEAFARLKRLWTERNVGATRSPLPEDESTQAG